MKGSRVKEEYYVAHKGGVQGPCGRVDLEEKLHEQEIAVTDYVWVPQEQSWCMAAVFFQDLFPAPTSPPKGVCKVEVRVLEPEVKKTGLKLFKGSSFEQELEISNTAIWFLYRDQNKFGPYRFLEIVELLQQKRCEREDFVWKPGMEGWEQIYLVPEFASKTLSKLSAIGHLEGVELDKVFIKRKFPRVPYDAEVVLHDDSEVALGSATSLSEGGTFVAVDALKYVQGDRLRLHFSPSGIPAPFNCIAEVVHVCKSDPKGYCLKFVHLGEEEKKRIKKFTQKTLKGSG